jgi:nucleoid-associated protein YgaU
MSPKSPSIATGCIEVISDPHAGGPKRIEFVFNPSKLALSAQANWEQKPQPSAKKVTPPKFTGSQPQVLKFEFLLDAWEKKRDLSKDIHDLVMLTRPTQTSRAGAKPSPPKVRLVWGSGWFPAYVTDVSINVTMFDELGEPLRAMVNITLKEIPKAEPGPNPTSGTRVGHDSYVMVQGDTLPGVAARVYDNPSYWRGLAATNAIDNPARIRPGTRVYLPPIDDVAAASR